MKLSEWWSTCIVLTLILLNSTNSCKKSSPPPKPRCTLPPTPVQVRETGGYVICSGHADRYFNIPKVYNDIHKALATEGGVIENGTLVIKQELISPREDPEASECHVVCLPGFIPSRSTSCKDSVWTQDPATMTCAPSLCAAPPTPEHGKYLCYGNPSTCYFTCDPGYVTMSSKPALTCMDGSWSPDPNSLQCEVAVALLTGGHGPNHPYPEDCQTAEVFSPSDKTCSSASLPLLKIGVTDHTSHLVDGEIIMCGGNECGRTSEKLFSKKPIYNETKSHGSCFKLLADNTWALHSVFTGWRWNHIGGLQQNTLQLIAGNDETLAPVLELQNETWMSGRSPSLPPTAYAYSLHVSLGRPCLVVTSPITYIVIGGSNDLLSGKERSSVLEFNSLTKEWRALPDIPVGRSDHACALVATKSGPGVMVAGGRNFKVQKNALDSVFLLDLGTEKWYPAGSLNDGRESFGLVVLGERVMVIGRMSEFTYGIGSQGKKLTGKESVEEYVVPCQSLKECTPSQEGVWNLTDRVVNRWDSFSVVPVAASRFNCTG